MEKLWFNQAGETFAGIACDSIYGGCPQDAAGNILTDNGMMHPPTGSYPSPVPPPIGNETDKLRQELELAKKNYELMLKQMENQNHITSVSAHPIGTRVEFWDNGNCPDVAGLQPGDPCMSLVTGTIKNVLSDGSQSPASYQILMDTDGGSGTLINGVQGNYITKAGPLVDGPLPITPATGLVKPTPITTTTTKKTKTAGMGGTNLALIAIVGGFIYYAYSQGLLKN